MTDGITSIPNFIKFCQPTLYLWNSC